MASDRASPDHRLRDLSDEAVLDYLRKHEPVLQSDLHRILHPKIAHKTSTLSQLLSKFGRTERQEGRFVIVLKDEFRQSISEDATPVASPQRQGVSTPQRPTTSPPTDPSSLSPGNIRTMRLESFSPKLNRKQMGGSRAQLKPPERQDVPALNRGPSLMAVLDSEQQRDADKQELKAFRSQRIQNMRVIRQDPTMAPLARQWLRAAARRDHKTLTRLVKQVPEVAGCRDPFSGYTALHWAAKRGDVGMLDIVLQSQDADINAQSAGGYTPLHLACLSNHVDMMRRLEELGADQTVANNSGILPHSQEPLGRSASQMSLAIPEPEVVELRDSVAPLVKSKRRFRKPEPIVKTENESGQEPTGGRRFTVSASSASSVRPGKFNRQHPQQSTMRRLMNKFGFSKRGHHNIVHEPRPRAQTVVTSSAASASATSDEPVTPSKQILNSTMFLQTGAMWTPPPGSKPFTFEEKSVTDFVPLSADTSKTRHGSRSPTFAALGKARRNTSYDVSAAQTAATIAAIKDANRSSSLDSLASPTTQSKSRGRISSRLRLSKDDRQSRTEPNLFSRSLRDPPRSQSVAANLVSTSKSSSRKGSATITSESEVSQKADSNVGADGFKRPAPPPPQQPSAQTQPSEDSPRQGSIKRSRRGQRQAMRHKGSSESLSMEQGQCSESSDTADNASASSPAEGVQTSEQEKSVSAESSSTPATLAVQDRTRERGSEPTRLSIVVEDTDVGSSTIDGIQLSDANLDESTTDDVLELKGVSNGATNTDSPSQEEDRAPPGDDMFDPDSYFQLAENSFTVSDI